jgi:NAD(P)-dependent dehydrogenase (short-subunit alcohol dehydrogenase family)
MAQSLVINVTGAATGFGALTARALAKRGHIVYAGLRSATPQFTRSIEDFRAEHGVDLRPLEQDMLSDASVNKSVQDMLAEAGRVDAIVHNCGHLVLGPAEAFTPQQLAEQYDINVLSTQRLNRAVLPHMRERRNGLLVWVSSSSVHGAVPPFIAPYFASKAGMDALAASYQLELSRWGIENTIMVPGAYSRGTNHFADSSRPVDAAVVDAYAGERAPYHGVEESLGAAYAAFEPEDADSADVAEKIADVVDMRHGTRPGRVHVDPAEDGSELVSGVRERLRKDRMKLAGHGDLFMVQ